MTTRCFPGFPRPDPFALRAFAMTLLLSLGSTQLVVYTASACTGKQDGGCSTVANAVSGGAAACDYGDLAHEAEAIPKF